MAVAETQPTPRRTSAAGRETLLLAAIVLLAAALRFATLGVQSLDGDEGFTADIASRSFGAAMSQIPHTESTPPLFYALTWLWAKLAGTSEYALRSVSALAGTLAVPTVYAIGTRLHSRHAGLVAAVLAAVSPLLVWYSQEARSYMLFMLLAALSFLAFLRALDGERRWLAWWALASAAALATHYFAAVTVVPEAIWLLARAQAPRRERIAAVAAVAVAALALLPLLLYQDAHVSRPWANALSVADELKATTQSFLVGIEWTWLIHRPGVWILGALAIGAALLAWRSADRRLLALPAAVAAVALLVPFLGSLVGAKYFTPGNELGVWPLLAVMLAAGAALSRIGVAIAATACVVMLAITIAGALDDDLQRDDWRGVVGGLNKAPGPRAIVLESPFQDGRVAAYYLKRRSGPLPVREVVTLGHHGGGITASPAPLPAPAPVPAPFYQR